MQFVSRHWQHHARFYGALVCAWVAFAISSPLGLSSSAAAIGGDVFFASYLIASLVLATRLDGQALDRLADIEDEGAVVVFLITLTAIGFASWGVFTAINHAGGDGQLSLFLALAGAPLGWLMLHTVAAFRYAYLYYAALKPTLLFPGDGDPCAWDFLYFAYVVGMKAQLSDVQVCTPAMRKAVLLHSVVSFFFNTVLIAMAVNAAVK